MSIKTSIGRFLALVLAVCALGVAGPARAQSIYEPYSFVTLAGSAGNSGTTDNTGSLALFNQPWGLAVDGAGNVYVADTLNHTIRKISPGAVVTTLAGVAGSSGFQDGPANTALLNRPTSVAVTSDGSVVYVADYNNHVIRQLIGGVVGTLAGSVGVSGVADGTGAAAQFHNPFGVALNASGTVLYVSDQNNQTIRAIALPGGAVTTLAGSPGLNGSTDGANLSATFNTPRGIAVDSNGNLYVADAGNFTVRKILSTGGVSTLAGVAGTVGFTDAVGAAAEFSRLAAISPFGGPCGLAVDAGGNLFVTDQGNHLVRKITPSGSVTTLAGLALSSGVADSAGGAARFNFPAGIAVDGAGKLYVADTLNHTIRTGVSVNCIQMTAATNKTVACGSVWNFDAPANIVDACCTNYAVTFSDVTNGICPRVITRTWVIGDLCGNSNSCSQSVTVGGTLAFFPVTSFDSASGVYGSPSGNGSISLALAHAASPPSSAQNDTILIPGVFSALFPDANNAWATSALSVRVIGDGTFTITLDLTHYSGLMTSLVLGFYNIRSEGVYSVATFDAGNAPIALPLTWHLLGNDDNSLQGAAATHLALDQTTGVFSTEVYQTGVQSDAAFWNQIPANTATIVITGMLQSGFQDGVGIYLAEPTNCCSTIPCITMASPSNKSVQCGSKWDFDAPTNIVDSCCKNLSLNFSAVTNGTCPQVITGTWVISDTCGNSNSCSQTVTVASTLPPVLVCATNKTVDCGSVWAFDAPAATDACSGLKVPVTILSTVTNGVCPQIITQTWQATDPCGNSASCSQTVTVVNSGTPVIQCPADIVVQSCTNVAVTYSASAAGACNSKTTLVFTPPSGSVFLPGTTNHVSVVATDECGNSSKCDFTVTVVCPGLPCANLVSNGSFELTSPVLMPNSFNNALDPATGVPGWTTDSTNTLEIWANTVSGIPASQGSNQLEINAQNSDETVSQVVTGLSINCPATFCFDYTGRFGPAGAAGTPNNDFTVTLTSGAASFSVPLNPAAYATGGWITFCTNFVPLAPTVTIAFHGRPHFSDGTAATQGGAHIDNVSLTQCCATTNCITLDSPAKKTVPCGSKWAFDAPTNIVDNCCKNFSLNFSAVTNGTCPQVITGTWVISDTCGNSNTCSQTVTVASTLPPILVCATNKTVQCGSVWAFDAPAATDACSGLKVPVTILSTVTNGVCPQIITRTWQAIDPCGNSASCSQTVTVASTLPPVLGCATNKTVDCGSVWAFDAPAATDACSGLKVPVTILSTVTNGVCPRIITRTWQAIDPCGNSASCSQTVTVVNSGTPVIQCPANIVVQSCTNVAVTYSASAVGACNSKTTLVFTPTSGSVFLPGTTNHVSVVATDECGNSSKCDFTVTVVCPGLPCANLVSNGSFELTSPVLTPNSFNNALDHASGVPGWTTDSTNTLEIWANTVSGIPASQGFNQLEINAQNSDETVSQVVTGLSINCPVTFCFDYTGRFGPAGAAGTPNNDFTVTLTSGAALFSVPLNPAAYATGGWITFCTNFVPLAPTVTIAFHGRPHFSDGTAATQGGAHIDNVSLTQCCATTNCITLDSPAKKTVPCGSKWAFDAPTNIVDNCCKVFSVSFTTVTNGTCPTFATRTWLISDTCGNSNITSQTVTVVDDTPPVIICVPDKTVALTTPWKFDPPTAADPCCGSNLTITVVSTVTNASPCGQAVTRTWQATGCCGNTASCSQTVTLAGTTSPSVCANPTLMVFSAGTTNDDFQTPEAASPSSGLLLRLKAAGLHGLKGFDDCALQSTFAHTFANLPSCIVAATLEIRLKACGSGAANDTFSLNFTTPSGSLVPSLLESANWGRYLGNGNPGGPGLFNTPWTTGTARTIVLNLAQLPNASGSTTDLLWNLNANGFLDLVLKDDSAIDYAILTLTSCCCQKDIIVDAPANGCCAVVNFGPPPFATNCSLVTTVSFPPSGTCFPAGTNLVESTATDAFGKVGRCFFKVIVRDIVAPVIVSCPTNVIACMGDGTDAGFLPNVVSQVVATDNCTLSEQLLITQDPPAGTPVIGGTVTVTVTDSSGNSVARVIPVMVRPCCVSHPAGLTLWLTFDEAAGLTAYNTAGGNNGILHSATNRNASGYVNGSLCTFGSNDFVTVPSYPGINPGTNDLTIDAWIKRDPKSSDSPPRIIVDKRDPQTGMGYSLALSFGHLLFQMASPDLGGSFDNYGDTNVIPADNQWHFIAVTVSRRSTVGGRFYLDGHPAATFDPTPHTGTLDSSSSFLVGNTLYYTGSGSAPWLGCIDEVEMFNRALAPKEISALFDARAQGKCRSSCAVPLVSTLCDNQISLVISAKICNSGPTPQTYNYFFQSSSGPGCSWSGPVNFTPHINSVTLPAYSCTNIPVTIAVGTGMPCGAVACYQMVIMPVGSPDIFTSAGSLHKICTLVCARAVPDIGNVAVGIPVLVPFVLSSTASNIVDLTGAQVRAIGPDGMTDMHYISLNGLPPGTPWQVPPGTLLASGGQLQLNVSAEFVDYSPGDSFTLVLEADFDGDGELKPLASMGLVNVSPETDNVLMFSTSPSRALMVNWGDGWVLQQSGSVTGPWMDVPGATSPFTDTLMKLPANYYRLIRRQ